MCAKIVDKTCAMVYNVIAHKMCAERKVRDMTNKDKNLYNDSELKNEFIKNFGEDHLEEEEVLAVLIKDCMHISVFLGVEALPK